MKLRATIVIEYEANPDHYDTDDPKRAAEIDEENFRDDGGTLIEFVSTSPIKSVKVESVEDQE